MKRLTATTLTLTILLATSGIAVAQDSGTSAYEENPPNVTGPGSGSGAGSAAGSDSAVGAAGTASGVASGSGTAAPGEAGAGAAGVGGSSTAAGGAAGTLPATGLDATVPIAVVGLVLLASGLALRHTLNRAG